MTTPPHPLVQVVVDAYLTAVDAGAPGLVQGLYLIGSVALGDFRAGASDIDLVAVTAARPDAAAALAQPGQPAAVSAGAIQPHA